MAWSYENMPKQQMNAEQLAKMKEFMSINAIAGGAVGTIAAPFIIWLVISLLFKFLNMFVGNEAPFKKLYAVSVITSLPIVLGTALRSILVTVSPAESYLTVSTSAAAVLPKGTMGPMFAVLSNIDPFIIWSLVLLAMGGAIVLKTSVRKTGLLVFIMWVLLVGVTVASTLLKPQQIPGA